MTDFLLYTDGSGYQDGFSGFCSTFVSQIQNQPGRGTRMGSMSGSTVDRAEMTALLEGLQAIWEFLETIPKYNLPGRKPTIHWYTDRESLALSVSGEYKRSSSMDLWKRFAWYEEQFDITPQWVERETDFPEFKACDLHASTNRVIIKNYIETL